MWQAEGTLGVLMITLVFAGYNLGSEVTTWIAHRKSLVILGALIRAPYRLVSEADNKGTMDHLGIFEAYQGAYSKLTALAPFGSKGFLKCISNEGALGDT